MSITAAVDRAHRLRDGAEPPRAAATGPATRTVAIGDPQSTTDRWFGALAAHGLLGTDGWLRPEVRLVAMGDYFDYHVPERDRARVEGVLILGWLAAHAPAQVTLVAGNHDVARVMEFADVDDDEFRTAAEAATAVIALPRGQRTAAAAEFARRFPAIPTPGYAARDFNAFTVEQRELVQRLLLADRFVLATTASVRGTPALLTHAGVTHRELDLLCLRDHHAAITLPAPTRPHLPPPPPPSSAAPGARTIAAALNDRLAAAIRAVSGAWRSGAAAALSLEPLHAAGRDGQEGGGLLYHRPADPERPGADPDWEHAPRAPRRYDPRTALPRGLTQVIGHTGHRKACHELARWIAPGTDPAPGGVRTLRVALDGTVTYARGVEPSDGRDAVVYMIDPEMHYVPTPADVAILELD
jgi:hypothetical protein